MFRSLSSRVWTATLAVCGILLIGTAAARADDGTNRSGGPRREARNSGPSARRHDGGGQLAFADSGESGRGRAQATGGQQGSREEKNAQASPDGSRGHRGRGHWAHQGRGQGRGERGSAHGSREGRAAQASHEGTHGHRGRGHLAQGRGQSRGERGSAHDRAAWRGNMEEAAGIGQAAPGQATARFACCKPAT